LKFFINLNIVQTWAFFNFTMYLKLTGKNKREKRTMLDLPASAKEKASEVSLKKAGKVNGPGPPGVAASGVVCNRR
jgi:hypothetical protein